MTASVSVFTTEMLLGAETQAHLAAEWSENAEAAGIERIAFVSEDIKARAVSANLDVSQEIETFQRVEEAVAWAEEV